MNRKIKSNGKHLTFSDRVYIEQELMQGISFRNISAALGKDPSTISKEIRLHCAVAPNGTYRHPHYTACNSYKKSKDINYLYLDSNVVLLLMFCDNRIFSFAFSFLGSTIYT